MNLYRKVMTKAVQRINGLPSITTENCPALHLSLIGCIGMCIEEVVIELTLLIGCHGRKSFRRGHYWRAAR